MAASKRTTKSVRTTPSKTSRPSRVAPGKTGGIEKAFLKSRPICKVKFTLPAEAAPGAQTVCLMGEFNNWSRVATPMKRQKNNAFTVSLDLEKGRSYRFRYLIDDCRFENDWAADRYEPNPFGGEDSIVEL